MPFPKHLLAEHERLVFDLKPHAIALVPAGLWTIGLIVAAVVLYNLAESSLMQNIIIVTALVAWMFLALIPFLRWRFTLFVLTTDRLITRSGIIAKSSKEIPLENINDVAFSQRILERIVGAGDLFVESAGERGQTRISNVRHPEQVQLKIFKETEANNLRMHGGGPGSRDVSVPEQIRALARLQEQGVISEAEFAAKKEELLKRM